MIEGASYRMQDTVRQVRFVGTSGQGPTGIGTSDWLLWGRWDNVTSSGNRIFDIVSAGASYYLTVGRTNGSKDLTVSWNQSGGGVATVAVDTVAGSGPRFGPCHCWAAWRDGLTLRCMLLADDGTVRTSSVALPAAHNWDSMITGSTRYIGSNYTGTVYSQGHWGHISMLSSISGASVTALTSAQWTQLHQVPASYAALLSGASLAMSLSRLTDSSGNILDPQHRETLAVGQRLVDTVLGNYLSVQIGAPVGDNSAYYFPNFSQPGGLPPLHNHEFASPLLTPIGNTWWHAKTNKAPSPVRIPSIAPLDESLKASAWPMAIPPRWRYIDSSDGSTLKTWVGENTLSYSSVDYHYCPCIAPGTGDQAIVVFPMHSLSVANEPETGDTLYESFGVYRVALSTGVVTWEQIALGGTEATNVFTYCALFTPPGATYTLALVRQAGEGNSKGYAVKIDHTSGAQAIQLTTFGTNITGFYPVDILDLGSGCYGFGYMDRWSPNGGPSGYHMLVWDSAGVFTSSTSWYNPNTGANPTLPLAVDNGGDIVHTINSGAASADRDQWTGNAIADGRGNVFLSLTQAVGDLDNGDGAGKFSRSSDAVYIRSLLGFSSSTHTFASASLSNITGILTALKGAELFELQPIIQWADPNRNVAYLIMAVLDGATLVDGTDYAAWHGEFGTRIVAWHGEPAVDPAAWSALPENVLYDTDVSGGRSVRPLRVGSPMRGKRAIILEAVDQVTSTVMQTSLVAIPDLSPVTRQLVVSTKSPLGGIGL